MTVLVIGANGYLGSHVTRQLVNDGQDVAVMVRDGANTIGIDDLKTTRFVGDIWNDDVLREAMASLPPSCSSMSWRLRRLRNWPPLRQPQRARVHPQTRTSPATLQRPQGSSPDVVGAPSGFAADRPDRQRGRPMGSRAFGT